MRPARLLVLVLLSFVLIAGAACNRAASTAPAPTAGQTTAPPTAPAPTPTPTPNPTPEFVPRVRFPFDPTALQARAYQAYLIFEAGTAANRTCPAWSVSWQAVADPQSLVSWEDFFRERQPRPEGFLMLEGERSLYSVLSPYELTISLVDEPVQMFRAGDRAEVWSGALYPFWQTADPDTARQAFERYWLADFARVLQQATWSELNAAQGRYAVRWETLPMVLTWAQDCQARRVLYGQVQDGRGTGEVVVTADGVVTDLELRFEATLRTATGETVPVHITVEGGVTAFSEAEFSQRDLRQEEHGAVPLADIPLPPKTQFFRQNGAPAVGGRWEYATLLNLTDARDFFAREWPRQGFDLKEQTTPAAEANADAYLPDYRLFFQDEQGREWVVELQRGVDRGTSFTIWAPAGARSLPTEGAAPVASAQGVAGAYCRLLGGQPTADDRCQWDATTACDLSALLNRACPAPAAAALRWPSPAALYCASQGGQVEHRADGAVQCRFGPAEDAVCDAWDFLMGECVRGGVTEALPLDEAHLGTQVTGRLQPGEARRYTVPYPGYPEAALMLGDGTVGFPATPGILVTWLESPQGTPSLRVYTHDNQVVAQATANEGPVIAIRDDEDIPEPFLLEVQAGDAPATFTLHAVWAVDLGDSTGPVWVPNGQLDADGRAYFYGVSRAGRFEATVEGDVTALGMHLLPREGHTHRLVLDPDDGRLSGTVQDRGPVYVFIVVQGAPGGRFQIRAFSYLP